MGIDGVYEYSMDVDKWESLSVARLAFPNWGMRVLNDRDAHRLLLLGGYAFSVSSPVTMRTGRLKTRLQEFLPRYNVSFDPAASANESPIHSFDFVTKVIVSETTLPR